MDLNIKLCKACKTTPWSTLASKKLQPESRPEIIRPLSESHEALRSSNCRVCRMLSLIKPSAFDEETCWLVAVSSTIICHGSSIYFSDWKDCTYLAIEVKWPRHDTGRIKREENLYIALLKDGLKDYFGTTKISPSRVNYEFVKTAMATCQQNHEKCHVEGGSNVAGLYVIDCRTGEVIPAPEGCQYLALSYIWGNSATTTHETAQTYPAVIHDSIKLTSALEYRYLWVDRICIRGNETHKLQMINAMDQIYSNAVATIIAAEGEDADFGLPGVGSKARTGQAELHLGDVSLLEHFSARPAGLLKSSKWASRGWTFQEGLLSRRRLVFTNQQVFFVCRDTFVPESVQRPYEYTWCLDHEAFMATEMILPSFREALNHKTKETLMYMKAHISEYTQRDLRFDQDSLRAIMGVLVFYSKKGVFHLWGVPVVHWGYHQHDNALQLDWYHPEPAKRRAGFPSWSYTGWRGAVEWTSDGYNYDPEYCRCEMAFTSADGELIPIANIKRRHLPAPNGEYNISKRIAVTSRLCPLTFTYVHQTQAPKRWARRWQAPPYPLPLSGLFATFPWTDDLSICAVPFLDTDIRLESGAIGLILHMINRETKHTKGAHSSTFMVLILQPVAEECYERVGIMMLDEDEAPAYLDGRGNVLDKQPGMNQGVYWRDSVWFKNSEEKTITLV